MTKKNPDILCPSCLDLDYVMNRKDAVSFDIFVVCNCDWEPEKTNEDLGAK